MIALLNWVARHARHCLVLGLLAGLVLPGLAGALRPWLPEMVAGLLFITALRIGHRAALGSLSNLRETVLLVLGLQVVLPLCVALAVLGLGAGATPLAMVLILALSAPSISGSPNFSILLGHDPAAAMRLLTIGTALFPFTVIPILWLVPAIGTVSAILDVALGLLTVIALSVGLGFLVRAKVFPAPGPSTIGALDGVSAIALAVIVVGLMSALGPAMRTDFTGFLYWLGIAFALNFGVQLSGLALFRRLGVGRAAGPAALVAGNRNIALFLVALPPETTAPLMIFIGCYQLPMYLTPVLLRRVYRLAI